MKYLHLTILALFLAFSSFAIPGITGNTTMCANSTSQFSDATPGGTWSTSNSVVATVTLNTGLVYAANIPTTATVVITYSTTSGSATTTVTINPVPSVYTLTGGGPYCAGGTGVPFSLSGSTSGVSYQLYIGSALVDTPVAGTGSALSFGSLGVAGTYVAVATNSVTACSSSMSGSPIVVINSLPTVFNVTGGGTYCTGGAGVSIVLSASSLGTNYQLYLGAVPVGPPVAATGSSIVFAPVTAAGTYSVLATNVSTGCVSLMNGTATVTTSSSPTAILGRPAGDSICSGTCVQLSDATAGGAWSMSNSLVAVVTTSTGNACASNGIPSPPFFGRDTIFYTLPGGCSASFVLTVGSPALNAITGPSQVCIGSTITLSDPVSYGTWTSSSPTIATVNPATGAVSGVAAGYVNIDYTAPAAICGGAFTVQQMIAVIATASPITGPSSVCVGAAAMLSDATSGGVWTSSNASVATIDPSIGVISAVASGVTFITYTASGGCAATSTVTVNPPPTAISGPTNVCDGSSITLSDATPGGIWSSSTTSVARVIGGVSNTAIVTGLAMGFTVITYTMGVGSCYVTLVENVNPLPNPITGGSSVCVGNNITLGDATPSGIWSTSAPLVATIGINTGIAYSNSSGTANVSYTLPTGCYITTPLTVISTPTLTITSAPGSTMCAGDTLQTTAVALGTSGNTYQWYLNGTLIGGSSASPRFTSSPSVGDSLSCVVTGISTCASGTVTLAASAGITVNPVPTVSASSSQACGGLYTLTALGATTYSWLPSTGLSCTACASTTTNPASSATYTVTGTTSGCSKTATVTVDGNRISGHITYIGVSTDSFRVWLINYNPTDSLILAMDSTISCMDAGTPYYQFNDPATGSYMVKAALFGTVPGTTGYIPSYGLSSATWNTATTVSHSSSSDSLHINMILGTVPSGPGFIGGNVYSGAGRGTSVGVPAVGMLIYLENTATHVLTYNYTDVNGAYSFSGLAYGDYIIYPEAYSYYTTPSSVITLNASNPSATGINFKQHTTFGTITPDNTTGITTLANDAAITLFPNPSSGNLIVQWKGQVIENASVVISDMLGREVYSTTITIGNTNGQSLLDLSGLNDGAYLITIKSDNIHFAGKLMIQK